VTRLAHLVRPSVHVADEVSTAADDVIHLELPPGSDPVYVRNGQAMHRDDVIALIFEADGVIVW